jgi:hypothetical protein
MPCPVVICLSSSSISSELVVEPIQQRQPEQRYGLIQAEAELSPAARNRSRRSAKEVGGGVGPLYKKPTFGQLERL